MDKYIFVATFVKEDDNQYSVSFKDLPGCVTCGENLADALYMAKDVLEGWLWGMEEEKAVIPSPTDINDIASNKGEFLIPIIADMKIVRDDMNNKTVTKNCTMPYWLEKRATKAGLNFSQVLQNALKEKLDL